VKTVITLYRRTKLCDAVAAEAGAVGKGRQAHISGFFNGVFTFMIVSTNLF